MPEDARGLTPMSRMAGTNRLELEIGLTMRNGQAFTNLLAELYDPASPNFHHFITTQQYIEQFAPSAQDYQAVIGCLQTNGLTVTDTFDDHGLMVVSGTVADIEKTFHLHLHVYKHPREARNFFAPDADPTLDLGVSLIAIDGLDNFVIPHPMNLQRKSNATALAAQPNAHTGTGPGGNYLGSDFRNAYIPGVTLTGAGQSVALFELDGYNAAAITDYESLAGLTAVPLSNRISNHFNGRAGANNAEVCLDIEMAIDMAPALSAVYVYEGTSPNSVLTLIANDNISRQISSSWSYGKSSTTTTLLQRIASQGQSFFTASGDSGAYTGSPAWPTDNPYLTSVGATTLTTSGRNWSSETVWNWFETGEGSAAGSGGISTSFAIPSWQAPVSMANNQGSPTARNIPDVALTGDDVWVVYDNGSSTGEFGGTSIAAPLWAGLMALINQQAAAHGYATPGLLNPAIYAIGLGSDYVNAFHDITTGNNNNTNTSSEFFAVPGYDLCTGWGTPTAKFIYDVIPVPLITQSPASESVTQGDAAAFSVTAIGGPPLLYQWRFDTTNISGATNATYSILNAQLKDAGNYDVVISNGTNAVTSVAATLTVAGLPPTITGEPQDLSVPLGNDASFSVTASSSSLEFYQWLFDGVLISGETNSSITIADAQLANAGNYQVVVSNTFGAVTSSNATLTITGMAPSITEEPHDLTVPAGSNATFLVTVTGTAPLSYQWLFNDAAISGATNSSFTIVNVQATNVGDYQVVISNGFGLTGSDVVTLGLSGPAIVSNTPPVITGQPANVIASPLGGSATFAVTATGSAPLMYQWFFDQTNVLGATNSSLLLTNLQITNAGYYQVIVSNTLGIATSEVATLTIPNVPVLITAGAAQVANGKFTLALANLTGESVIVQSSSNFVDWIPIYTNPPAFGQFIFTNFDVGEPMLFYRVVTLPSP